MNYMLMPLRRYADFEGRSRRKEYWMWVLFNFIVSLVLWGLFTILFLSALQRVDERGGLTHDRFSSSSSYDRDEEFGSSRFEDEDRSSSRSRRADREDEFRSGSSYRVNNRMFMQEFSVFGWVLAGLAALWGLISFIPNLAVAIRRLHDLDKSGWMLLLGLIPLVGAIILLVFFLQDGTRGPNRFGPDPKGQDVDRTFA